MSMNQQPTTYPHPHQKGSLRMLFIKEVFIEDYIKDDGEQSCTMLYNMRILKLHLNRDSKLNLGLKPCQLMYMYLIVCVRHPLLKFYWLFS